MSKRDVHPDFTLTERKMVKALHVTDLLVLAIDELADLWMVIYDPETGNQIELLMGDRGRLLLRHLDETSKELRRTDR